MLKKEENSIPGEILHEDSSADGNVRFVPLCNRSSMAWYIHLTSRRENISCCTYYRVLEFHLTSVYLTHLRKILLWVPRCVTDSSRLRTG